VGVIDEVEMPGGTTVVFGNQGGPKPVELHRSNLDAADEAGKRIAQRNYWLDVAAHCVRRMELVVVVILTPVVMVVSGNQGGAKPGLEVYRRSK
jgi:hypothetical protein